MVLQNRVTPTGDIVAVAARGQFMGNRGILHDDRRQLGRSRWKHKAWIICLLCFRGRKRVPMTPHRYTELFFFDEAVAIAAGHRPCYECRRRAYRDWCAAWQAGHGEPALPRAGEMDARLHGERVDRRTRRQRVWSAPVDDLPDGTYLLAGQHPHLLLNQRLLPWSPEGYWAARPRPAGGLVTVLTPPAAVAALRGGYRPIVHASAAAAVTQP
ncbi:MAG: hypothetical protein OEU46_12415 [Alphaproteobacteria bacterium]|nr:hypothetical protein [Alphaproteobacteria bacterium]